MRARVGNIPAGVMYAALFVVLGSCAGSTDDISNTSTDAVVATALPEAPAESTPVVESASAPPQELDPNGCPVPYPDPDLSPYRLPFAVGQSIKTGLTNCSSSFHGEGKPDGFAYDFDIERGGPISAARGGTVTFVHSTDETGAGTPGGNQINIDHGDGTIGIYLHFEQDSVTASIGDEIAQGDPLGTSGSSGLNAGYPHLHFIVVEAPGDFPWIGIPVTFSNVEPRHGALASNTLYEAIE